MRWRTKDRAARAIRFIESYCRAPKGYGHGELMKLGGFQKLWIRAVLAAGIVAGVMACPRGQGKSTLLAALAVWATFDRSDTGSPQVPIIATTVGQAVRSVYGVAVAMIKAEPELAGRCVIYTAIANARVVATSGGEMFPMANDPDGLQGLDPSLAVIDEIGFQPLESWDSLYLASGKRERSVILAIGTPGLDRDNALWHLRQRVREGYDLPGFHFTEYAADEDCEHTDEAAWRQANPALGEGFMNLDALRAAVAISPEAHFRIFRLGQWVDGTDSWLGNDGRKVWAALADPYELVPGAPTWAGLDVGIKRDSTALVLVQRRPDGRMHARCKLWLPTKDEAIDVADIMRHIRWVDSEYRLDALAYDPRLFEIPAQMLADEGIAMFENPQSLERMTPAFGDLFEDIKRGSLSHDGDTAFTTQVLNAIPRWNQSGFTLKKAQSRGKIDATYALAMACDRARHPAPVKSPLVVL